MWILEETGLSTFTSRPTTVTGSDPSVCDPLHLSFQYDGTTSPPGKVYVDGATAPTPNGCCIVEFDAVGCNSMALDGATVNVWTDSGKTTFLASGVTGDGSSPTDGASWINVNLAGSVYFEITCTGFNLFSSTQTVVCRNAYSSTLTVATGYHCITACAAPIPDTLHATHPVFGAVTLSYSAGSWIFTKVYAYPGFGGCAASTVTITGTWNPASSGSYTESWKISGTCPDDAGGSTHTATWNFSPISNCPPSFAASVNITPAAGAEQNLYQRSLNMGMNITI